MSKKKESVGSSLGSAVKETCKEICWLLTILFCALRACNIITWSWFWVMPPIFFSWTLSFVCLAIAGLISFTALKDD